MTHNLLELRSDGDTIERTCDSIDSFLKAYLRVFAVCKKDDELPTDPEQLCRQRPVFHILTHIKDGLREWGPAWHWWL